MKTGCYWNVTACIPYSRITLVGGQIGRGKKKKRPTMITKPKKCVPGPFCLIVYFLFVTQRSSSSSPISSSPSSWNVNKEILTFSSFPFTTTVQSRKKRAKLTEFYGRLRAYNIAHRFFKGSRQFTIPTAL